ncbi:MAG TPA: hypothetical protein VKX39_11045 [Bryobacteraceae bacterium]|jgi:hypothetical protein|nr:hypothetical protein [Bryobacteraceae bacterium]
MRALVFFLTLASLSAADSPYYRMKLVKVIDQHGFERPLTAMTMLIPTDWTFQSDVVYKTGGCSGEILQGTFKAASPDGRTSIEMFPVVNWQWNDAPAMQQAQAMVNRQQMAFGRPPCQIAAPMTAADFLRRWEVPKIRPNARIAAIEPIPDVAEALQKAIPRFEAAYRQVGVSLAIKADVARARLAEPGSEEWISAITLARSTPNIGGMGRNYGNQALKIFALKTPAGKLTESERFFRLVLSTITVDPQWQARVTQAILNIQAAELKGARDRSRIIAEMGQETNRIITEGYNERQRIQDQTARQFDQYIRGVQTYRNPDTGEQVELSYQYSHAWGKGNEYILTDNPNFNPNIAIGGGWTQLQPVK